MSARTLLRIGAVSLGWAGLAEPALAHTPLKGVGTFYAFLLHPIFVPSHLLTLTASGLFLSQQPARIGRNAVGALMGGLVAGFAIAAVIGAEALPEACLLSAALIVGAFVSLGMRQPPPMVVTASGLVGTLIGLDSAPDQPFVASAAPAYAGLMFGVSWIVLILQGYASEYVQGWPAVAKRVVGSWIVAISVLVLTLSVHPPAAFKSAATFVQK